MKIRVPLPKLKLYQQIIAAFVVIVLVPLASASFVIYSVNQKALKKELRKFTEHTVEGLYKDFSTEMKWQRHQSRTSARLFMSRYKDGTGFEQAVAEILAAVPDIEGIGLYSRDGELLDRSYRNFAQLSPELRLPEELGIPGEIKPFQVRYFDTGDPKESPYYLQAVVAYNNPPPFRGTLESAPAIQAENRPPPQVAYYVELKRFDYLREMVRSHRSVYDHLYIIDSNGYIIAGPTVDDPERQQRISEEDYDFFTELPSGVTREFSTTAQTLPGDGEDGETDDDATLQKAFVKIPDINWGIIIESPYHVRQKYIKRARNQTFLLVAGCLLVVILLAMVYVYGIYRNFRQLIKATKAMAGGNYFRRIRLITNFFTPYEIIYLAGEFNRMARKTSEAWMTIQETNRELAKLDELKSNLIDTVSHELRTPLTNIKGYTSRLQRYDKTLDDETRQKSLKVIKKQADRLTRLVEDLLVIPDLEHASLRVYPDRVDLADTVEHCVVFIQEKDQRMIEVNLPDSDLAVLADPDRLEQILLNLLDNAVKYSKPDTPIFVNVRHEMPEGRAEPEIGVTVSNYSDPIPEDEIGRLFDKFKRLDDSMVRTTQGSGLGLFITKGLVEAMGGKIRLSYSNGIFEALFTLPVYRPAGDASETPAMIEG